MEIAPVTPTAQLVRFNIASQPASQFYQSRFLIEMYFGAISNRNHFSFVENSRKAPSTKLSIIRHCRSRSQLFSATPTTPLFDKVKLSRFFFCGV